MRNPIAKSVRKIRPQVVPDKREHYERKIAESERKQAEIILWSSLLRQPDND